MNPEMRKLLELIITDPNLAADALDDLGDRIKKVAAQLRAEQTGYKAPGGMDDRVKVKVYGPNGEMKQQVDTGLN